MILELPDELVEAWRKQCTNKIAWLGARREVAGKEETRQRLWDERQLYQKLRDALTVVKGP